MTQLEILNLASLGICAKLERYEATNARTKVELGRENSIAVHHIEKLRKQFDEISDLIFEQETGKKR